MERQRLADFRRATRAILAGYAVDATHMKFVAGLDCVIFRIWLRGHRCESVTLRFYPEYYGGAGDIAGEIDWLHALARDTQLLVPTPIAARDGSLIQPLQPSLHGMHWCVLLSWVPGRFLYKSLTSGRLQQVGAFTAALHNHAEQHTRMHVLPADRCAYLPECIFGKDKTAISLK